MYLSFFDDQKISDRSIQTETKKLARYRKVVNKVVNTNDDSKPEYSLVHAQNPAVHDQIDTLRKKFKGIKHLVLVGIGGSNLGTEAIHSVLDSGKVELHSLDTISAFQIEQLLKKLSRVKSAKQIAICIISKSGGTAETMVNGGILLEALEAKFKKAIYKQTIFIGDAGTEFQKAGKKLGVTTVAMPKIVGGRYSVSTEVGLIPLALLGHDTDAFIAGLLDANNEEFESITATNAARLALYAKKGYRHYNFFAFESRLYTLGAWYRQLQAESLGKAKDRKKQPVKHGFLPTISTAVELHSVGQLLLSGFAGVYTDFVTFDDDSAEFQVPKKGIAKKYGAFEAGEVATAIYGGVMSAYQDKNLPYRSTIFDENLAYSLGLFMGMRMRETMYVANLLNLNAFDQPNVESYKIKTREILGL